MHKVKLDTEIVERNPPPLIVTNILKITQFVFYSAVLAELETF